ncbi:secreted protein [Streptomyces sp. 769]|nr:secreted protein [Streptomyces sp. 769]
MIKKVIAASVATGGLLLAGAGASVADAGAGGSATGSPGVLSGNQVQVPVHIPVNACGNTVDVVGALNPAFGNDCVNGEKGHARPHHRRMKEKEHHNKPQMRHERPAAPHAHVPAAPAPAPAPEHRVHRHIPVRPQLAKTGEAETGLAIASSVVLLMGGTLLYRRGRRAARI